MNTSEQHKATRGSCLLDLFLRPVVGLLGLLTVGERGEVKNRNRESPEQPRLVPAKVGRFLGMVMYDNEFETKENKNLDQG